MTNKYKNIVLAGAIAGIAGCAGDFLVIFVFGNYFPGYHQQYNTMSSLGASISPVSGIVSSFWILLGLIFIFFGYTLRKAFSPVTNYTRIASLLVIIYGLGEFVGSGLFKADHIGNTVTKSAVVHGILGTIGITALMLLPLVMPKIISRSTYPGFNRFSRIILVAGIALLILFNFRFFHPEDNILNKLEGLWQRLFALDLYIYLLFIAYIIIKERLSMQKNLADE